MKKHLIKFLVVGGISTLINMGVFYLLYKFLGIHYIISSGIGFISGMIFGYYYNKKWTYESNSGEQKEKLKYFVLYVSSLLVSIIVLKIEVEFLRIDETIANVMVIILTTIINFIGTKYIVFKR